MLPGRARKNDCSRMVRGHGQDLLVFSALEFGQIGIPVSPLVIFTLVGTNNANATFFMNSVCTSICYLFYGTEGVRTLNEGAAVLMHACAVVIS